jgi:hypothetical protein
VALEDAAGLLLGVAAGARVGVERLGARFAAQLGDRHAVQDGVHAAVGAGVEAAADGLAGPVGGGGGQRCAGVKAREAGGREAAPVADLDEQPGNRARREPTQRVEG